MTTWLPILLACSSPETPEPAAPAAAKAAPQTALTATEARGKVIFGTHCATCHGQEGHGNGPAAAAMDPAPQDLHGPRPAHLRGIPRRKIIEEGLAGTAMVGWKGILPEADLEAVYAYVHTMKHGPGSGRHECGDCVGGGACGDCPNGQ